MRASILLIALAGCATGAKFTFDQVARVHVGMTQEQVRQIMPEPTSTSSDGDLTSWIWYRHSPSGDIRSSIVLSNRLVVIVPTNTITFEQLRELEGTAKAQREAENQAAFEKSEADRREKELQARIAETRARDAEAERGRQEQINELAGVSGSVRQALLDRKVLVGMTTNQVVLSWGRPQRITITSDPTGSAETWSYGDSTLFFAGGLLKWWHQVRTVDSR